MGRAAQPEAERGRRLLSECSRCLPELPPRAAADARNREVGELLGRELGGGFSERRLVRLLAEFLPRGFGDAATQLAQASRQRFRLPRILTRGGCVGARTTGVGGRQDRAQFGTPAQLRLIELRQRPHGLQARRCGQPAHYAPDLRVRRHLRE